MGQRYMADAQRSAPSICEAIPFTGSCAQHRRVLLLVGLDPHAVWAGAIEADVMHQAWPAPTPREVIDLWLDADSDVGAWIVGRSVGYGPPGIYERAEKALAAIAAFRCAVAARKALRS